MNKQLRILILEDRPSDAKLMVLELLRAGFDPQWRRVDTEEDYLAELALAPDIILSDYNLPHFSAPRALGLLSERGLDIPFIIVSGSIGEEVAVQAIQQGASDYLLKDRLGRLGSAVSQALKERQLRDEKRRAELALRESQERFRLVVESAPNGMVMIDRNGAIVFVNVLTEKLFGYPRAELLGQPLELLVPERSRAKHPDLRRGFFATPSARSMGEGRELYGRRKGGSEFPVNISLSPIETPEGLLVLSTIVDITERKQLEEQYRHAQKMEAVGKLAGGVAHDFNNLLTVIMGYSEIQLRTLRPEDPLRVPFNEIRKAGEQAASLTRQLLVFSRKQVLMPVVLDLNAILTAMEKMLCRLIGEDVALTVLQGKSLWRVKADPGQMEQVVMNLVVNARDAMPLGGKLLLETKNVELEDGYVQTHTQAKAGEHVLLAISDAGCGMDAAVKARIFEPFFTTKDPGKGTGLGLATVYGIVRQSGGHIEVYSEVGQGTTFKIYLPRDRGGDTAAPSARAAQPARGGTETILLVEDEEGVRALAKTVLQRNGYTIIDAKTGGQALSIGAAHSEPIALLITDVVMPNLSGRQLAERLALLQPNMAVLYISGYTDDAIIHHGVLEAGTPFLQKPFTPDSLARKVREVLDEAQRRLT